MERNVMKDTHRASLGPALDRLISRRQLRQIVPASDMSIWRWERDGIFPPHVSINRRNFWRHSEVAEWLAKQSAAPVENRDREDKYNATSKFSREGELGRCNGGHHDPQ